MRWINLLVLYDNVEEINFEKSLNKFIKKINYDLGYFNINEVISRKYRH